MEITNIRSCTVHIYGYGQPYSDEMLEKSHDSPKSCHHASVATMQSCGHHAKLWPPCKVVATMLHWPPCFSGHHAKLWPPCKVVVTMQSCCHHASLATMQSCHHASVANKHTHHTLTVCDAAVNFPCQTSSHLFTSRLRTASSNS